MCVEAVRTYFSDVRDHVRDERLCRRQLDQLARENAPHAQAARARLQSRIVRDEAIIARAHEVIYGRLLEVDPVQAHVLWWRYLDDATWRKVANVTGRSERSCQYDHDAALAAIDSWGLLDAVAV